MNKLLLFVILVGSSLTSFTQNAPYADASNKQYWKNRKPFEGYWQQDVDYKIKAKLDDKTDVVDGEEELVYTNNSPDTLYFVYFHLYQNAFVKGSYLEQLNIANDFKQKFGKYESEGKGTLFSKVEVSVNNKIITQNYLASGVDINTMDSAKMALFVQQYVGSEPMIQEDNSIVKIMLPAPLKPNESATFKIDFKTYFDDSGNQRRRMKLFKDAWGNKQYDGVHWYPRICVYDRKFGWETDQHLGKEFYGDFGKFEIELTFPNNYVLDATGVLQNPEEVMPMDLRAKLDVHNFKDKPLESAPSEVIKADGTFKTWKFKSINTHDFAWVADPTFRIGEVIVTLNNGEKVSCISLSQEPHSAKWQDASSFTSRIIETYSRDIGNYVYPKIIVADARDGMEYPMLTLDGGLSPGYYGLLAHEVGHNWFFGMVGNNETYRASLDEGFTQFLTNWSMTSLFGEVKPTVKNPHPISRMDQTVYYGYLRDAMKNEDMPLNTHSDDFNGALNHGGGYGHVYYKTATMLYNLQYVLGDELFLAAMQHYFDQWKMAHPYFEDFRNSIINFTHVDLNWFFDQWLETTKTIDYSVDGVSKSGKVYNDSEIKRDKNGNFIGVIAKGEVDKNIYTIRLRRVGEMQMPIDLSVYGKDSGQEFKYLISNTYFSKKHDANTEVLPIWKGWGNLNETYEAKIWLPKDIKIKEVKIDPTYRLADIYQMDNSTGCQSYWMFDKGKRSPIDRRNYVYEWRPDIWYNGIDGIKAGLHLEGNFMNYRDVFKATVWYNTKLLKDYNGSSNNKIDYAFSYRNGQSKGLQSYFDARRLDGLNYLKAGMSFPFKKTTVDIYYKLLSRINSDVDYLLYPSLWQSNKNNFTLNIDLTRSYSYVGGNGELKEALRTSMFSGYDYSRLYIQWTNHHQFSKLELHSRLYLHFMAGSNIAPESQLYLGGANSEDMMDNKFIRSRAFVPVSWLGYGTNYNHFQAAGGLNVRGYAGYLIPRDADNVQVYMFKGQNGGAINLELDIDGLVRFKPSKISNYLHLDAYLFGDVGSLNNYFKAGEYGLTQSKTITTGIMSSAGTGFALTIKKWGQIEKAKPLTLRFDIPLFLSNAPFVDGQYFKYRWQFGINRSF